MSVSWSIQQLAEFLAAVSLAETEEAAAWATVERTAEALDAEVAAIVSDGEVLAAVGYPEGAAPVGELAAVAPGVGGVLSVPGLGVCSATGVRLQHPQGATLVVGRCGSGLGPQEASLLRGIAHASSITMRMLRLLEAERAAREEGVRRHRLLEQLANEQAALRRVATLVARAASPEAVFGAVAAEVGRLCAADVAVVFRFEAERIASVVGVWNVPGVGFPDGARLSVDGDGVTVTVLETGRPARTERFAGPAGSTAGCFAQLGARSGVGAPITVEGRLWGAVVAAATDPRRLPVGSEASIAGFTELVATAVGNAQARVELRGFGEEQGALRRLAMLVARGASPEEVFAVVAAEVGQLLCADFTTMGRYEPDGTVTIVGERRGTGEDRVLGARAPLGGWNVATLVFETVRPTRIEDFSTVSEALGEVGRGWGIRSGVGVPISVEGRLWGFMFVGSTGEEPMPTDTEVRLARFSELVATAVANAQARLELRGFAEEQAALRRVATLVARAAPPEEVFAAVTEEVGRLLDADFTSMGRYEANNMVTGIGQWRATGADRWSGVRVPLGGRNVTSLVFETGRPERLDDYAEASGAAADIARGWGARSTVGVPIRVQGRLWGLVLVSSTREESLPADTEVRLAGFTELVATAIANAEAQAQLTASRARIVAAADDARRRIERDLHDGAQQRLISLALGLRAAQAALPPETVELHARLDSLTAQASAAMDELRELGRGIHPSILADGGLGPALKALARRCPLPVVVDAGVEGRLPERIETAAYYVISEALANVAKHAHASVVHVTVVTVGGDGEAVLRVQVRDDGRGGADIAGGSGLVGLKDRIEALRGTINIESPPGNGTALHATLPITEA